MTARRTPKQRLCIYRAWAMTLVAVTVYVLLVLPVEYYGHSMHDPWFVFPNIGVLVAWWGAITRTIMAWDRLAAARRRAAHP